MSDIKAPKKLIEVALPLDDINAAAAREKSIRHGHPSTLHLWWARRPLAAARAVIFAQMVNDPGGTRGWVTGKSKAQAAVERENLFDIIRDLVKWENTNNEEVLNRAREAIRKSWRETCEMNKGKPGFDPEKLPAFHDPFAGGGAIPLEAQRLGLESHASDLNPVAVMINKAMIEIPPRFANCSPVGPVPQRESSSTVSYKGAEGLAEDVRRYGIWMREQAMEKIGKFYPPVEITAEMAKDRPDLKPYIDKKLTVIAWIWARTVKSPNPQFSHVDVPLASTFILASKKGKEAYVQPVVEGDTYHFEVKVGTPPPEAEKGTKLARGAKFKCLMTDLPMDDKYIKKECLEGRAGVKLMAVVAESNNGRVYLPSLQSMESLAIGCKPIWIPETPISDDKRNFWTPAYGLTTFGDLFTKRQLVALNTFSDLIQEARKLAIADAKRHGMLNDERGLADGGSGVTAYSEAISVYLSFAFDKLTDLNNSLVRWENIAQCPRQLFGRQAIPMIWDFAEPNLLSDSSGGWITFIEGISKSLAKCFIGVKSSFNGKAIHADAQTQGISCQKVISTDPPYYDNIGYADLSDFFYIWMRKNLKSVFPALFSTMTVPKAEELVATPYRHGNTENSERFFLNGMTAAMHNLVLNMHEAFPVTIYYAFKSSDTDALGTTNTGWETFLEAVLSAGFSITGTWPMRTENGSRMISQGTNALASSIVLVCRKREVTAAEISRRDFIQELKQAMPEALRDMLGMDGVSAPIAPVDLAQAAIGPGMEIFSKYKAVLNQDGSAMNVHDAMVLINREITEFLNPDSGSFDPDTLFCNEWYSQYAWASGPYGTADTLARAKGTSVGHVAEAGVITSKDGKVQLLTWQDYPDDYQPGKDKSMPVWEACHHLIRILNRHGETAAGAMLAQMAGKSEDIRQLAYYLYTLCERKGNADDARFYNELMTRWHAILVASNEAAPSSPQHKQEVFL